MHKRAFKQITFKSQHRERKIYMTIKEGEQRGGGWGKSFVPLEV